MKRTKMIYAVVMAVIYVAATLASSLAVLTCDHPHHTHTHAHANDASHICCVEKHQHSDCTCNHASLFEECCDHSHSLLGENHTDFIVEKQRGDDAMPLVYALDIAEALIADGASTNPILPVRIEPYQGYEQLPLQAAFSRYDSLRAPPSLA